MVKKSAKVKKSIITIIIIIAVIILGFVVFKQLPQTGFLGEDSELLSYCSTEGECANYLANQGMPYDYLETNGITINCENGECYAQK